MFLNKEKFWVQRYVYQNDFSSNNIKDKNKFGSKEDLSHTKFGQNKFCVRKILVKQFCSKIFLDKQNLASPNHCKLLQLKNKLQGKAVTHSEKLEW